jgi:Galactose mutarotase and related enzymes
MKVKTRELRNQSNKGYDVYDISTGQGLTVSVLTLGAAIQRVVLEDKKGNLTDLALGFPNADPYETGLCYAGATLAPNAGRIRNALLPVGPDLHRLTVNDHGHQLHGGPHNLSLAVWKVESVLCQIDSVCITLSAEQSHGLDGYPGHRKYYTTYTLEDTNWLTISLNAVTDRPTYLNMSNHTYWNLAGAGSDSALTQDLHIPADNVCINDEMHLPADIIPVNGTAFDFRRIRQPCNAIRSAKDPVSIRQLKTGNGYNHAYLLNKNDPYRKLRQVKHPANLKKACVLSNPRTGHTVKMFTDAPALVMYSGGFLAEGTILHQNAISSPGCAIALEAQDIPDVMHLLPEACHLSTPDHPFSRTIRYHIT